MAALRKIVFSTPAGKMTWEQFKPWFYGFLRDEIFKSDFRDAQSEQAVDSHFLNNINLSNRNSVQDADEIMSADGGSGPSTASITILAHTVIYDFGEVAYNGGTITDLEAETFYWVYTDDPRREGGPVSYSVTTNPELLIGKGIYYVGGVETPADGGGSVTSGGGAGAGIGGSRYDFH